MFPRSLEATKVRPESVPPSSSSELFYWVALSQLPPFFRQESFHPAFTPKFLNLWMLMYIHIIYIYSI